MSKVQKYVVIFNVLSSVVCLHLQKFTKFLNFYWTKQVKINRKMPILDAAKNSFINRLDIFTQRDKVYAKYFC